jgi:predicted RNase H-like nuclease (RuvC/YqgF family)
MIKEALVSLTAAAAGAGLYFSGLLSPFVPYVTGGISIVSQAITTNPVTTAVVTAVGSAVTGLAMRSGASKAQEQLKASASEERTSIISQAQNALTEQNTQITSLQTQVDSLTTKVQETAQLKTQVTTLKASLSAAEQQVQRAQDNYNAIANIKAQALKFPVENPTCH